MGAAQDRARTNISLVMACSQLVHECPQATPAELRCMDLIDSKSSLFARAFARKLFNYDGPHPNLNCSGGPVKNKTPDRSTLGVWGLSPA